MDRGRDCRVLERQAVGPVNVLIQQLGYGLSQLGRIGCDRLQVCDLLRQPAGVNRWHLGLPRSAAGSVGPGEDGPLPSSLAADDAAAFPGFLIQQDDPIGGFGVLLDSDFVRRIAAPPHLGPTGLNRLF